MRILTNVYSDGGEYYESEIRSAVVTLARADIASLRVRRRAWRDLHRRDAQLDELWFWNYACTFYDSSPVYEDAFPADLREAYEDAHWVILPDAVVLDEESSVSTELDQQVVAGDAVKWVAVPKYGDVRVHTTPIPLVALLAPHTSRRR